MKRSFYPAILIAFVFVSLQSCNGNHNNQNVTQQANPDTLGIKFLKTAIEGGLTEIKASELAGTHAKNPRVADFAKMVIADHDKANDAMKVLEVKDSVAGGNAISSAHNKSIDSLSQKSGAKFDKAYIKNIIKSHERALLLYLHATQAGDSTIRIFAKKTLPVIQMHLDSARKINKDLK